MHIPLARNQLIVIKVITLLIFLGFIYHMMFYFKCYFSRIDYKFKDCNLLSRYEYRFTGIDNKAQFIKELFHSHCIFKTTFTGIIFRNKFISTALYYHFLRRNSLSGTLVVFKYFLWYSVMPL